MVSFWCVHYGSSNRNIVVAEDEEELEERKRSAVESVGEKGYFKEQRRVQPAIGETMQDPPVHRCLEVASRQLRPFSKKPCSVEFSGDVGDVGVVGFATTATGSGFIDICSVTSTGVSLAGALFLRTGSSVLISSTSSSSSVSSKSNELMRDFMSFSVQETEPQCRRK